MTHTVKMDELFSPAALALQVLFESFLISGFYEQFSGNDSAIAPEWLSKNFLNIFIFHFYSFHIIYSFEACNLEILNM